MKKVNNLSKNDLKSKKKTLVKAVNEKCILGSLLDGATLVGPVSDA